MSDTLNMSVSSIVRDKNGEKMAYVFFSEEGRSAEGVIPACRIKSSTGFSDEEIEGLENYMRENLSMIKTMAAGVRLIDAFMKD